MSIQTEKQLGRPDSLAKCRSFSAIHSNTTQTFDLNNLNNSLIHFYEHTHSLIYIFAFSSGLYLVDSGQNPLKYRKSVATLVWTYMKRKLILYINIFQESSLVVKSPPNVQLQSRLVETDGKTRQRTLNFHQIGFNFWREN